MTAVAGVIIFVLGAFAGAWMSVIALAVIHQIASDLAGKSAPEKAAKPLPVPVVEIPVILDAGRVVEVGFSQALREEAQRIGRLN